MRTFVSWRRSSSIVRSALLGSGSAAASRSRWISAFSAAFSARSDSRSSAGTSTDYDPADMRRLRLLLLLLFATPLFAAFNADQFKGMQWREVGPFRGGRADAVEGIVGEPNTYYFGSCGGGVWKTTDAGQTWKNVTD